MRTVPCMAGCDGPMFTVMSSVGSSCSSSRSSRFLRPRTSFLISAIYSSLLRVVLAQRVPDELVVHVDPAQVGVTVEGDAVHVVGLALEPVERRPQAGQRR